MGVVGDAREQGIDRVPVPVVYLCLSAPGPTPFFLMRTSGDPLAVVGAVRARMKELEPQRSVYDIAVLDERIDGAYALRRLLTLLLVAFSLSALSLASVGLYGTLSYTVGLRRREVGLRMALGALRADIVRQFLGQGLRVVGLACAAGVGLALALRRVVAGLSVRGLDYGPIDDPRSRRDRGRGVGPRLPRPRPACRAPRSDARPPRVVIRPADLRLD